MESLLEVAKMGLAMEVWILVSAIYLAGMVLVGATFKAFRR